METAQTEARSVQAVPASRPRVAMAAAGDLQRVKRKQKTSQALGVAKVPVVPPSVSQPTKFSISRTIPAEEDSEDGMCFGVKEFPTESKSPRTIFDNARFYNAWCLDFEFRSSRQKLCWL